MGAVLVVSRNTGLARALERLGLDIHELRTTFAWRGENGVPAAVLLDLRDPDHATAALEHVRSVAPDVPVLVLGGGGKQWRAIGKHDGVRLIRGLWSPDALASLLGELAPSTAQVAAKAHPASPAPPTAEVPSAAAEMPADGARAAVTAPVSGGVFGRLELRSAPPVPNGQASEPTVLGGEAIAPTVGVPQLGGPPAAPEAEARPLAAVDETVTPPIAWRAPDDGSPVWPRRSPPRRRFGRRGPRERQREGVEPVIDDAVEWVPPTAAVKRDAAGIAVEDEAAAAAEAEAARLTAEDEARLGAELDAARVAAEEEAARLAAEEQAARLAAEAEAEAVRLAAEREAARLAAAAEAARLAAVQEARLAEERARFEAEEAGRLAAEEEAARLAAEEEAARLAAEAEAARLEAEQEAGRRVAAEAEAARLAAALEAARLAAEEEAARLAAEQEARLAEERARFESEEAARLAAEEEAAQLAAEREAARLAAEAEARLAEERARFEAEEAARLAAERESARLVAEAEVARLAAEREAARLAAEEEAARLAAEAEAEAARLAAEEEAGRVIAGEELAAQQAEVPPPAEAATLRSTRPRLLGRRKPLPVHPDPAAPEVEIVLPAASADVGLELVAWSDAPSDESLDHAGADEATAERTWRTAGLTPRVPDVRDKNAVTAPSHLDDSPDRRDAWPDFAPYPQPSFEPSWHELRIDTAEAGEQQQQQPDLDPDVASVADVEPLTELASAPAAEPADVDPREPPAAERDLSLVEWLTHGLVAEAAESVIDPTVLERRYVVDVRQPVRDRDPVDIPRRLRSRVSSLLRVKRPQQQPVDPPAASIERSLTTEVVTEQAIVEELAPLTPLPPMLMPPPPSSTPPPELLESPDVRLPPPPSSVAALAAALAGVPSEEQRVAALRSVMQHKDSLLALNQVARAVLDEALSICGADAGALLVAEDETWSVVAGVALRPREERLLLGPDHWAVTSAIGRGLAILVEHSDIVRQRIAGMPLASWEHLLVAPVGSGRALLILARSDKPFGEDHISRIAAVDPEAALLLDEALQVRDLARALKGFS